MAGFDISECTIAGGGVIILNVSECYDLENLAGSSPFKVLSQKSQMLTVE